MSFLQCALIALATLVVSQAAPHVAGVDQKFGNLPLYFEQNKGQLPHAATFVSRNQFGSLVLSAASAHFMLPNSPDRKRVSLEFVGANAASSIIGEDRLAGRSNYYLGADRYKWIENVPHFGRVRYQNIYPATDLVWHSGGQQIEYDLLLRAHADPSLIRVRFTGADSVSLTDGGDVLAQTPAGDLRQLRPVAWQMRGGKRIAVDAEYVVIAANTVGIHLADYDRSLPLTIDPVLTYSSFLGGSSDDSENGIAVDGGGNAYVVGSTSSADFPGTSGTGSLYAAKLNATGTALLYATYFGGGTYTYYDQANGIAVDGGGNAWIAGKTASNTFPVTAGTLRSTKTNYDGDAYVLKLDAGGHIVAGTFLGGNGDDGAQAIALDNSGTIWVAGTTASADFPSTVGAYLGSGDAFLVRLNSSLNALLFGTWLGGSNSDAAVTLAMGPNGTVYVAGNTSSGNIATSQGAFQPSLAGQQDGFVAKFSAIPSLAYMTYLGGSAIDTISSLAVDTAGNAYVGGSTTSSNFPVTAGAFDTVMSNYRTTGFVTKLNPAGTAEVYSTFLGGSNNDSVSGIAVDTAGAAYVTGNAQSADFPTTPGAFTTTMTSGYWIQDIFVAKISPDGASVTYSGTLGSTSTDSAAAISRSTSGALYIAGSSSSANFPTTPGAYETQKPHASQCCGSSVFVTRVDMQSPATCTPLLSTSSAHIPGHGGSASFTVTVPTGCPWEALADNNYFITVDKLSHGVSSGTASFTVGVNNDTSRPQTGKVEVGSQAVTVTQDAGSCTDPVFDVNSLAFDASGGLRNVNVTLPASCPRNVVFSDGWLQLSSGGTAGGSGAVTVFAASNAFGARTGTLTIAGRTIPVSQAGGSCTANVSGPSTPLPAAGGTGVFQIAVSAASCVWNIYDVPSWMHINAVPATGMGNGTVAFVVAPNPSAAQQTANLNIAGQPVSVSQAAGPVAAPDSYTSSVFAGGSYGGQLGDAGPAFAASFYNPIGLAWRNGTLYVADWGNHRVRAITADGIVNTVAGGGLANSGPPVNLYYPVDLTFGGDGTMYVVDGLGVVYSLSSTAVPIAGIGTNGVNDLLASPSSVAVDASGNVLIADTSNNRIRRVSGGVVTTIAGSGFCSFTGDNGPASAAALCYPTGLLLDSQDNLYFSDAGNARVRRVTSAGTISTFAGGGSTAPVTDVPGAQAALSPGRMTFDALGNLYVIESGANRGIVRITTSGSPTVRTVSASFEQNNPTGIAADENANLYVSAGNSIWKLTPAWSFCDTLLSGGAPSSPSPANGATGAVVNVVLTWTGKTDATSYDVYFGTTSSPALAGNTTCNSYTPPTLEHNATYYWKVVAKNGATSTSSPVWSFRTGTGTQFNDVSASATYFDAANRMFEAGVTTGCVAAGTAQTRSYCPDNLVTRQEMAAFIVRAVTGTVTPAVYNHTPYFLDVPASNPFFPHIQKLMELGITTGCSQNPALYCPTDNVPRWQMAMFMVRARLALHGASFSASANPYFADVPVNYTNGMPFPFVQRAYEEHVTNGCNSAPLVFCPDDLVTRGQMASFIMRALFNQTLPVPSGTPQIAAISPAAMSASPGTQISVTITGANTNFQSGDTVAVPSGMLTVSNVVVHSPTSITATLAVNAATLAGPQAVLVTTGGTTLTLPLAIKVGTY